MGKYKKFCIGVKGLIINSESKILLLQINLEKRKFKDPNSQVYWDMPGGLIEESETIESTLKKEIKEKTGIDFIENAEFFHASISNIEMPTKDGILGRALFVYKTRVKDNVQVLISDEHIKHGWFFPKEASELLKIKYPQDFTDKISFFAKEV